MKSLSIYKLKQGNRGAFITYQKYLDVTTDTQTTISEFSSYDSDIDYARFQLLRDSMKEALKNRKEVFGLSAQQIGIPASAVYIKYRPDYHKEGEIFLTDPEMHLAEGATHKFFLKVIKCPTSPIPYHIGVFSRELVISSSNGVEFKVTEEHKKVDPQLELSAALQTAIWADKGYVIGDNSELLLSYIKTCFFLEQDRNFKEYFDCIIHKDEIERIIKNIKLIDVIGFHKTGAQIIITNFIKLLCKYPDQEWIPVPPINMLKEYPEDGPYY